MENKAAAACADLNAMEELSSQRSPIHRLHPLVKLIVTIAYTATVVSFPKYALSGLSVMVLFPVLLYQASGIPMKTCFVKLRFVLPLVLAVGLANPFLDRVVVLHLGRVPVTAGMVSMVTLMLKGVFTLMMSFLLVATTKVDALCLSLRKLHVPELLVTLFLLTYRYIAVMAEQVSIMTDAYALRAPGQKGIAFRAWGSFLGQLLLRSMDKAGELYVSMQLRGFDGSFSHVEVAPFRLADGLFLVGSGIILLIFRFVDLASLLGGLLV